MAILIGLHKVKVDMFPDKA